MQQRNLADILQAIIPCADVLFVECSSVCDWI